MTPLFTALIVVPGAVLFLALAFVAARFFQPTPVAIRMALVFVAGTAIGGGVTVVGLSFFVPATLVTSWQVIAYLASLAVGALLGGALLLVFCIKHRALTLCSSGPPQAASA